MSLLTWLVKYIPVPANDPSIKTWLDATRHSIRKWEGLRKTSILKEGVRKGTYCAIVDVASGVERSVGYDDCALCQMVESKQQQSCRRCPLYRVRGTECDSIRRDEKVSPWVSFTQGDDPEPMIFWLKKAEARLIAESNRKKQQRLWESEEK